MEFTLLFTLFGVPHNLTTGITIVMARHHNGRELLLAQHKLVVTYVTMSQINAEECFDLL